MSRPYVKAYRYRVRSQAEECLLQTALAEPGVGEETFEEVVTA